MLDCLDAALAYAKRGWYVFPLNGKKPYEGTAGFHDATTDRDQIRAWWDEYPDANVGIACNSNTGPIVIDIDGPSGAEFIDSLNLSSTREASSGSADKRHLYYDPPRNGSEVKRRIRPFGKSIHVDVLGDGGYVVAPPSIHPDTDRVYQWVEKRTPRPFPKTMLRALKRIAISTSKQAPRLPAVIDEGERDNLLTSLAGTMRRRGASEDSILAALRQTNEDQVNPPLPDKDLKRIARSIGSKEPAILEEHLTDLGNARRFVTQHQEHVRSIMVNRRPWYVFDNQRWVQDHTGEVDRMAKATVRSIYREAANMNDEDLREEILKHAVKSESMNKVRAMMEAAATEPELSTTVEMLDANKWLFNVENGTIDLRSGVLRDARASDLITKLAPVEYDADATAPRWDQFISEIMEHDEELIDFIQRAVGYSLTGDTREHCLFFLYGQGSNGKSTFLEILRELLGDYAQQADFSSFLSRRGEGPRNDIARMRGSRFVAASEADGDRGWDGAVLKQLTGGDTVVARKLYEEAQEFTPQHKLWLAANHKPIVREQTEGFWRRIRLIPFARRFKKRERDKKLRRKLQKEMPGILNWAIEGCLKWKADGLMEPKAVRQATQGYKEENDVLGEFVDMRCRRVAEGWTSTVALYQEFVEWWQETRGQRSTPLSIASFGRMLGERSSFIPTKKKRIRGWSGLEIRNQNPTV